MRKTLLFVLFLGSYIYMQACVDYVGVNQVYQLLTAVTDKDGNDWPHSEMDIPGYTESNWKFDGSTWIHYDYLTYYGCGYYYLLDSVDWSNFGNIQKADSKIVWLQPDIYDPNLLDNKELAAVVMDNDLQALKFLNFSGNQFREFELDGSFITPIRTINFSNNPTLEHLLINNCRELEEVNVTNSGLPLTKLYEFMQTVVPNEVLKYAPQGTVSVSFPYNRVDLRVAGTASNVTWDTGHTPIDNDGVYVFDSRLIGEKIRATLTNSLLPDFDGEGIVYEITLTEAEKTGIQKPAKFVLISTPKGLLQICTNESCVVGIFAFDGRKIKQQEIPAGTTDITLAPGRYIVRLSNSIVQKILVK